MKTLTRLGLATIAAIILSDAGAFGRGFGGFHGGGSFGGFHSGGFGGGFGGMRGGGGDFGGFGGNRDGGFGAAREGNFAYREGNIGGYREGGYGYREGSYGGGYRFGSVSGDRFGGLDSGAFRSNGLSSGFASGDYGGALSRGGLGSFLGLPTDTGFHALSSGLTGGGAAMAGGAAARAAASAIDHPAVADRAAAIGGGGALAGRGLASRATAAGAFRHFSATAMHVQGLACQHWCDGHHIFTPGWCADHPWAWHPGGYAGAAWAAACWRPFYWTNAALILGADAAPAVYDYGDNITYQDGDVYYGDQSIGSQQQYYQQAANIADSAPANDNTANDNTESADWLPLGVFGLMAPGQKTPDMVFQLTVDKQGTIRGNYYDQLADTMVPVHGAVNKNNQRVAWHIGTNKNMIIETGLYNLTKDQSTALVHLGPDSTEQFVMVRMKEPQS